jgi:hypothetical protein
LRNHGVNLVFSFGHLPYFPSTLAGEGQDGGCFIHSEIGKITHAARAEKGSVPVTYTLLSLPLYLVEALPGIVDRIRAGDGEK